MEPHIIPKHESGRNAHTRHKGGDFPMPMDSSILAAARGKPEGKAKDQDGTHASKPQPFAQY
jgi:hypothetical protein